MSEHLTRREFLKRGVGAAASVGVLSSLPAASNLASRSGRKHNILFVFADQLRYSALGCTGNPQVISPNIDRLASQGMSFTNAYSGYPLCTPYRAMLVTGRYCHSTGVATNDIYLPQTPYSIANVLKEHGYQTGYIGKWHLDGHRRPYVPKDRRQGFDFWMTENCNHQYFNTNACYGDERQSRKLDGYAPDIQTDLAINYVHDHKDAPFFLCISWGPPHNPYIAPEKYIQMYNPADIKQPPNVTGDFREQIAHYYAQVTNLDYNFGRLMKVLADEGIEKDTILVFTSDHGDMLGSQGQGAARKQRPWDESIHVPFILRYPGRVKRGSKSDVLLNTVDVMPTLLALTDTAVPNCVEGHDLSPFALGQRVRQPDSIFLQELMPISSEAKEFGAWRGVRTKQHTYARFKDKGWVLYDNKKDPYQLNNLIDKPEARDLQKKLEAELQGWLTKTNDDFASAEEWRKRIGWQWVEY